MTTRHDNFIETVTGTMKINPDDFSTLTSPNRLQSFGYSLAGWLYMLRYQKNTRIMSIVSILVLAIALWLQIEFFGLAVLVLAISMVWMAEFLNAAVEAVVNLASPDYHPMAKVAKDVASASVLLGVVASVMIGLLVLGPPLFQKLTG